MKTRCLNPNANKFKDYGGRGITICPAWMEFMPFYLWAMANGYRDDLSLERKKIDSNYNPDNCKWASQKEQANNTRRNVYLEFDGQRKTNSQWAELLGITETSLRERFQRGWSIEKALTTMKIPPSEAARIASRSKSR
jgi:hypothetical protein